MNETLRVILDAQIRVTYETALKCDDKDRKAGLKHCLRDLLCRFEEEFKEVHEYDSLFGGLWNSF